MLNKKIAVCLYSILVVLYGFYLFYNTLDTSIKGYIIDFICNVFFMTSIYLINKYLLKINNKISYIMMLVIYLIMMLNMTTFKRSATTYTYNLIPFKTLIFYFNSHSIKAFLINVVGNIIIVMPLQFLFIKGFKIRSFKRCIVWNIGLILFVELLQFITHTGVFDVDDFILNLSGMIIAYFITNKA